ncbi:MAG: hypothetical protein NT169_16140 [Chloroflexi bacterium]|nr:hypothetical protein [Chloroflexota bacterium]
MISSNATRLLTLALTLLALSALLAPAALAQTAVPTPAPTRTATPTLTALQAKLLLAQTLLMGGDFAGAAKLFSEIAAEDHGNPEALRGLKAALDGQAASRATAVPTLVPPKPARVPAPSWDDTLAQQWRDLSITALAGLILLVLVYLVAKLLGGERLKGRIACLFEIYRHKAKTGPMIPPIINERPDRISPLPNADPAASCTSAESSEDMASVVRQLAELRENLRLIDERKSQYVQETEIPLQLIKTEGRLKERIAELEARLRQADEGM